MFCLTVWVLAHGKKFSKINHVMLTMTLLLFVLSTIHIGVDLNRIYLAFVKLKNETDPITYLGDASQSSFIFKNSVYAIQTALSDGIVLYRAYMVWRSPWPIALPALIYLAVIGTGISLIYHASISGPNNFSEVAGGWIIAFYASTFSCNMLGTMILAVKLWWMERSVSKFKIKGRTSLKPVLWIVVDSGLLISMALFTALICFVSGSSSTFIVNDFITPIISISFYAVIIRVSLVLEKRVDYLSRPSMPLTSRSGNNSAGTVKGNAARSTDTHRLDFNRGRRVNNSFNYMPHTHPVSEDVEEIGLEPLKVNITEEIVHNSDSSVLESGNKDKESQEFQYDGASI